MMIVKLLTVTSSLVCILPLPRPSEMSNVACREILRSVMEKAKRITAMTSRGQLIPLRSVPPSSEKTSHRTHTRNEAKYAPVATACVTIAVIYAPMNDSISSTVTTPDLTLVFVL